MNMIIYEHEAHKLAQPTCRYCGLPIRWGKGYAHVDGFEETGVCGSRWFPDYPGKDPDGKWSRSTACREIVRLRISQLKRMADVAASWAILSASEPGAMNLDAYALTPAKVDKLKRFHDACHREAIRLSGQG